VVIPWNFAVRALGGSPNLYAAILEKCSEAENLLAISFFPRNPSASSISIFHEDDSRSTREVIVPVAAEGRFGCVLSEEGRLAYWDLKSEVIRIKSESFPDGGVKAENYKVMGGAVAGLSFLSSSELLVVTSSGLFSKLDVSVRGAGKGNVGLSPVRSTPISRVEGLASYGDEILVLTGGPLYRTRLVREFRLMGRGGMILGVVAGIIALLEIISYREWIRALLGGLGSRFGSKRK
jgi:hypothetical protein